LVTVAFRESRKTLTTAVSEESVDDTSWCSVSEGEKYELV